MLSAVLVMVLFITVTHTRPYALQCSEMDNLPCTTHRDCCCIGSVFLCSPQQRCKRATPKLITSLLPCPGIYKSPCTSDADCKCKTHPLKCEENECVNEKKTIGQSKKGLRKPGLGVKLVQGKSSC